MIVYKGCTILDKYIVTASGRAFKRATDGRGFGGTTVRFIDTEIESTVDIQGPYEILFLKGEVLNIWKECKLSKQDALRHLKDNYPPLDLVVKV